MAVVSVTAQNQRLTTSDSTTGYNDIGGGGGSALETDFFYQGTACVARKGATGQRGFYYLNGSTDNLSGGGTYTTVLFKYVCSTPGLLESSTSGNVGQELSIGSATGAHYDYDVQFSDTYPAITSFLVLPIDPNVAGFRDRTTGSPNLAAADYYGLEYDQTGSSKSPNQGLDAIDLAIGLTLVGGDGADPDGVFQDFSDFDFGNISNRFGYVRELDGIFFYYGTIKIGSATATVFNDSGKTITFPDGLFAPDWSNMTVDLQNASTDVDWASITLLGQGTAATSDTRPVLIVTGTSGDFLASSCVFDNFANFTLTNATELNGCLVTNQGAIDLSGATLDGCTFNDHATASGVAMITASTFNNIQNCSFDNTGGVGHAIEIDTAGTYTATGNTFVGYGVDGSNDAALYNNSGGLVTINLIDSGGGLTFRNGVGATTVINNAVTVDVSGVVEGTSVQVIAAETVGTVTTGDVLAFGLADSNGEFSFSLNYEGAFGTGLDVTVRCRNQGFPTAGIAASSGGTVFVDETTANNSAVENDITLLPISPTTNDAYYWGHGEKFNQLKLEVSTVADSGFATLTWEYWNGSSWASLPNISDGTNNYENLGVNTVSWTDPSGWATTSVNSQGPYYYVRARQNSLSLGLNQPKGRKVKLDVSRYLPFTQNNIITSSGLSVVAVWIEDTISTF